MLRRVLSLAGITADVLYEATKICSYRDNQKKRKAVVCVMVHLPTTLEIHQNWSVQPFHSLHKAQECKTTDTEPHGHLQSVPRCISI